MRVVENLKRAGPWIGFLVVALVLLALITAGWEQWRITLPLFVTGFLIGWIVGMLMSPVSPHETEQFSEYGKAISTFIAGFLVAKLALEHVARAMRLSPLDPLMFSMQMVTGLAHFVAGRYADAATWAEKAFREQPNFLSTIRLMAATNALAGRLEEAHKAIARGRAIDPSMRISNLKDRVGPFQPEDFARYAEALRMAGLPE